MVINYVEGVLYGPLHNQAAVDKYVTTIKEIKEQVIN